MASHHQNSAKRLKALLRRVHFPVQRFKQLPDNTNSHANTSANTHNPWDGIVSGDPRAALIVLHWTLLDMSPLFAEHLLDREYGGLHSLTDFKFVSRCLKMLRDEFGCRPQLTAEQFLTCGYAEVKMRLLAEIVELVMRTHHSLAQHGARGSNSSNNATGRSAGYHASGGTREWSAKNNGSLSARSSDGGDNSPWSTPLSHQLRPGSRSGSLDGRSNGSGSIHVISLSPRQSGSPPPLCNGPFLGGGNSRYSSSLSPSGFSDEQNGPGPVLFTRGVPRSSSYPGRSPIHPFTVHASGHHGQGAQAQLHQWSIEDPRGAAQPEQYQYQQSGSVAGGAWGSGSRVCDDEIRNHRAPPGVLPLSSGAPNGVLPGRSPLGPRSVQPPHGQHSPPPSQHQHHHLHDPSLNAEGAGTGTTGLMPPNVQCPSPVGQESDWAAVQKAFGSPNALHMPLPPPMMVPASPPSVSPTSVSYMPPRSGSSATTPGGEAGDKGVQKPEAFGPSSIGDTGTERTAIDSDVGGEMSSEHSNCSSAGGSYGGSDRDREDAMFSSLSSVMAKTQMQIEAMLEQQSRVMDERMKGIEQMLSARLTLLETRMNSLENSTT